MGCGLVKCCLYQHGAENTYISHVKTCRPNNALDCLYAYASAQKNELASWATDMAHSGWAEYCPCVFQSMSKESPIVALSGV